MELINKIYHGDSYELIKKIPDKSIDLIYVDVPYLMPNIRGGDSGGFMSERINRMSDEDLKDIKSGFDFKILDEFVRINKTMNIFIWVNKFLINDVLNYFINKLGCKKYEIMFWGKSNPIPMTNNVWLSDVEYCLWFGETATKLNDGYHLKSKYYISPINKSDKDLYDHPTIKPLDFVKQHIEHTTQKGDLVFDAFLGSGTTAVAAKELGRNYLGFEIDENYFNISKDRLNGVSQVERREKEAGIQTIFDLLGDD